jgi:hypothetical protein
LALPCTLLGSLLSTLAVFAHPAALLADGAVDLAERLPEAERSVADGELRRNRQTAAFEIQEQFQPGLRALAVAIAQADDVLEIQPRRQLLDRLGASQIGRQDRRGEADAAIAGVPVAVANPRSAHGNRPDPGLHLALRQVAVAHHPTPPSLVQEISVLGNESLILRLNCLGQQTPRARNSVRNGKEIPPAMSYLVSYNWRNWRNNTIISIVYILAVQGVSSELVSVGFPVLQGKYRENSRFGPDSNLSTPCKLLN